jgi:hypothetical protein
MGQNAGLDPVTQKREHEKGFHLSCCPYPDKVDLMIRSTGLTGVINSASRLTRQLKNRMTLAASLSSGRWRATSVSWSRRIRPDSWPLTPREEERGRPTYGSCLPGSFGSIRYDGPPDRQHAEPGLAPPADRGIASPLVLIYPGGRRDRARYAARLLCNRST